MPKDKFKKNSSVYEQDDVSLLPKDSGPDGYDSDEFSKIDSSWHVGR